MIWGWESLSHFSGPQAPTPNSKNLRESITAAMEEASVYTTSIHDEQEERDVWSNLETLKKLYGLLHKTAETNTEGNNEQTSLDHESKVYLMKLLDEATQNTLTLHMKMLPSPLSTHLASTSSFQRLNQSDNEGQEQNLNNSLRYSFQRRDSDLFKSQLSIKSRQSQAHCIPTHEPSHPIHPMSRYHGRSGIDRSSKHAIGGSPIYPYHKEKSLYCPSEHHSRSSAHKTAEMTTKQISVSPKHGTNLIPNQVCLDKMSSRVKSKNQYRGITKECCSNDGTTSSSSSDSNSRMLDQRRIGKIDKRIQHHKRFPAKDRKKKLRDNLSADSCSQSNSVSSFATSSSSSSSSKGSLSSLPTVPFQKPGPLSVVPFQKSGLLPVTARSRKPFISQHDHNKSLHRVQSTRHHKSGSPSRNPKNLAKETDKSKQKKGRFKRLKDKLAIVFHHRHDHHHYHHHHTSEDGSTKGQVARANKDHRHRSLWKYLKGKIVHHSSEQTAYHIVPSQHHHHKHLRALFRMLFGHFWGNKRRKKTRLGRTASRVRVKKLRWWHRVGRARHMKLKNGKKARLRLRYGAGGESMKKGNKR